MMEVATEVWPIPGQPFGSRHKECHMSKGQHGNREAKKPKKAAAPSAPATPSAGLPTAPVAAAARGRKR